MAVAASLPVAIQVEVPAAHWDGLPAVDIFAPCGTPWLAVFDGVAEPRDFPLGGYALLLTASDGTVAYYAHGLADRARGPVQAGQVIGYVSDSGNARGTGCHLHFAVGASIDSQGAGDRSPAEWLAGAALPSPVTVGEQPGREDRSGLVKVAAGIVGGLLLLDLLGG